MPTERVDIKIERALLDKFMSEFKNFPVEKMIVHEGDGHDGDRVLYVQVIYDEKKIRVKPSDLVGVVRRLRPALIAMNEDAFPVMSFISSADVKKDKLTSSN